jgi:archaellum component FlaG (FlaF/FlaG flagellin family)
MAAQAASELIFFIGAVVISASLVGVFFAAVSQVSDSINDQAASAASASQASVTVLNDPAHVVYNNTSQNFSLAVKNTGSRSLSVNETVVLLDQFAIANDSYVWTFVGNHSAWSPGVSVSFTLTGVNLTASRDHFLKVIAEFGASDTQEFFW